MFFDPTKPPTTFHVYINKILVEKLDVFVIVYLDDILFYNNMKKKAYVEAI